MKIPLLPNKVGKERDNSHDKTVFWFTSFSQSFSLKDEDLDIVDSNKDKIDEDSAIYLESLQEKVNKHMSRSMQVLNLPKNIV